MFYFKNENALSAPRDAPPHRVERSYTIYATGLKPTSFLQPAHQYRTSCQPKLADNLVHTLERRNSLALSLVQGVGDDTSVGEICLSVGRLLETEGVLHPVLVVTIGVIFSGVCTSGLLSCGC